MFTRMFRWLFGRSLAAPAVRLAADGSEPRRGSSALSYLLESLEEIGDAHSELYDTDVRERIWGVVEHRVIRGDSRYAIPTEFGMFSGTANRMLHDALARDLTNLAVAFEVCGLRTPEQRLHSFQNPHVKTPRHGYTFEYFFGSP